MKIVFTLLCCFYGFKAICCNCIGESSHEIEFIKSDIIFVGSIRSSRIVKIWSDTSYARYIYETSNSSLSYDEFKYQSRSFGPLMMEYIFKIDALYKGETSADTVVIRTGFGNGDCGFKFEFGVNYLVYAINESKINYVRPKLGRTEAELKGLFRTDICSRTGNILIRQEDLEFLIEQK